MKTVIRLTFVFCFCIFSACSKVPTDPNPIGDFYNYPNPFKALSESTTFKVSVSDIESGEIQVFSQNGDLVAKFNVDTTGIAKWHGTDKNGKVLPSTLYNAVAVIKNKNGNILTKSTKTIIR